MCSPAVTLDQTSPANLIIYTDKHDPCARAPRRNDARRRARDTPPDPRRNDEGPIEVLLGAHCSERACHRRIGLCCCGLYGLRPVFEGTPHGVHGPGASAAPQDVVISHPHEGIALQTCSMCGGARKRLSIWGRQRALREGARPRVSVLTVSVSLEYTRHVVDA